MDETCVREREIATNSQEGALAILRRNSREGEVDEIRSMRHREDVSALRSGDQEDGANEKSSGGWSGRDPDGAAHDRDSR